MCEMISPPASRGDRAIKRYFTMDFQTASAHKRRMIGAIAGKTVIFKAGRIMLIEKPRIRTEAALVKIRRVWAFSRDRPEVFPLCQNR